MTNDKFLNTIKILLTIEEKAEKGKRKGIIKCPFCSGIIHYIYLNNYSFNIFCNTCGYKLKPSEQVEN